MKLKEEFKDELFKDKEEFVVNKKTVSSFFKRLTTISERLQKQKNEDSERLERSINGTELKAKDLEMVAKNVILELAHHINHADFVQRLVDDYKSGRTKHKPRYYKQEQADKYKMELTKLFHSLCVKLRLAFMFGFGEEESMITVVDTKKLPSLEKAKKMDKQRFRNLLKKAEDNRGRIDNKSTKIFKDLKK